MLKVVGVDVLSVGEFEATDAEILLWDVRHRKYCKLVLQITRLLVYIDLQDLIRTRPLTKC